MTSGPSSPPHWRYRWLLWFREAVGCTPAVVPPGEAAAIREQVRTRPLIVAFEGLQPFSGTRARDISRSLATDLRTAASATSGNWPAHTGFIREANQHSQPVYLVGYSMGGSDAIHLAQWCKLAGIPVRIVFLLDPAGLPGQVPDNVGMVVLVRSSALPAWPHTPIGKSSLADPAKTRLEVIDLDTSGHDDLPYGASLPISAWIGKDLGEVSRSGWAAKR